MNINSVMSKISRGRWAIVVWVVALVVTAIIATWATPQSYEAGSTVTAIRGSNIDQKSVDYYLYDNYYSIQSGGFIADSIVSWLSSAPTVAAIYKEANIQLPESSLKGIDTIFTAKKESAGSNVVTFTTSDTDPDKAETLITSANKYIAQLVKDINKDQQDESAYFTVNFSDPVVVKTPKSYVINAAVAGLLGLMISLSIVFYKNDNN